MSAQGTSGAWLRCVAFGVSDRRLVTQQSLDAFAQVTGEERFVHLDAAC